MKIWKNGMAAVLAAVLTVTSVSAGSLALAQERNGIGTETVPETAAAEFVQDPTEKTADAGTVPEPAAELVVEAVQEVAEETAAELLPETAEEITQDASEEETSAETTQEPSAETSVGSSGQETTEETSAESAQELSAEMSAGSSAQETAEETFAETIQEPMAETSVGSSTQETAEETSAESALETAEETSADAAETSAETVQEPDSESAADIAGTENSAGAEPSAISEIETEEESEGAAIILESVQEEDDIDAQSLDELSGNCGEDGADVTWKLEDGVLTISGSGAIMDSYTLKDWYTGEVLESQTVPWDDYRDQITEVIIENGVTKISSNAFISCYNLKKVTIAGSVKTIRYNAFANDSALTEVIMEEGVEKLGDNLFWMTGITSLTLPSSVNSISPDAFNGMDALQNFYVSAGGTYSSADGVIFSNSGKTLTAFPGGREGTYTVPDGVTEIAENAFAYSSLTTVVFPDSVTEIGEYAFTWCTKLTSLTFPSSLKVINDSVCWYASSLSSVTIPSGVTEIKSDAFYGCSSLTEVTIPATVTTLADDAFPSGTVLTILNSSLHRQEDGTYIDAALINVRVKESYSKAFEVLELVNQERTEAGASALVMDQSLLSSAMQRAAETVLLFSHTRPSGSSCFSANSGMYGENIACGSSTASGVMNQWMNSSGHKANILSTDYTTIGIGCVEYGGTWYWVQCFGADSGTVVSASSYSDQTADHTVAVKKDSTYYLASFSLSAAKLKVGETANVTVDWNGTTLKNSGVTVVSSDSSVLSVQSDGSLKALKAGTAVVKVYYESYPEKALEKKVTVTEKTIKVKFNANGGTVKKTSLTVTRKAKFGTLPSPERKGYTFAGWYTKKKGGTKITAKSKVTQTKTLTLYAHWKKVKVSTASIKKAVSRKSGVLTVSVKKLSGVSGYQIVAATDKSMKKNKKSVSVTGTAATLKGLKKGKTYYVKVRAWKKDSAGKKVYGSYSKVKKVTIHK